MKKLVGLAIVGAMVLAACGGGDESVASVNELDIPRSSVEAFVYDTSTEMSDAEFAQYLGVLIQWEAIEQKAEESFGLSPSEDEVDERMSQILAEEAAGVVLEEYLEARNVSKVAFQRLAKQLLIQDELQTLLNESTEPLTDEEVAAEIAANPLNWTQACAAHLLVATEEEALAAIVRIDDGEEFAVVATEVSTDTASALEGGDLGCSPPGAFVEPFANATMEATIGVRTEPIETEFGFHVILVSERTVAEVADAKAFLEQQSSSLVVNEWYIETVKAAVVTIEDGVGAWITDPSPQVVFSAG
ncbi:MAG: peptidylprolyl isomerase [Acidimicrobiia bacterium]